MIIGVLEAVLFIHDSRSLKDKRLIIKSLKDRLHHKFNVSVAETDSLDKWQRSVIGIALVGGDQKFVEKSLNQVFNYIDRSDQYEVVEYHMDYVS